MKKQSKPKNVKSADADEDGEKASKKMKKDGKITMDAPKVKERKHFAPTTQKHKTKKGKGSYDRKEQKNIFESEKTKISKMIEAIIQKNHAEADKYLKDTINSKIKTRINKEIDKPLF